MAVLTICNKNINCGGNCISKSTCLEDTLQLSDDLVSRSHNNSQFIMGLQWRFSYHYTRSL